ncbi:MAG: hypothetical protein FJ261_14390 [Planctomycetes bacterium]|nr:hypothetical protein [Planctomycetota bacterium]
MCQFTNDGRLGKPEDFFGALKTFKPLDWLQASFPLPRVWASSATKTGMVRPSLLNHRHRHCYCKSFK